MRVDQISSIYESYKTKSVTKTKSADKVQKKDEIALSTTAKDFQAVYKALSTTPDIRVDKVGDIKEKMKSGNYNVAAEEVADKIMSNVDLRG